MYIRKARIQNIRSIIELELSFPEPAGWHVLIGDNGAGKSSIIRSLALVLVGEVQAEALRQNWSDWINKNAVSASARLELSIDPAIDYFTDQEIQTRVAGDTIAIETTLDGGRAKGSRSRGGIGDRYFLGKGEPVEGWEISGWEGFFSAAYGPYRRFRGGSSDWTPLYKTEGYEDLVAHLSVFDESVALTEAINWLHELDYKQLEKSRTSLHTLENLKQLINSPDFLPHEARLESISSEGVTFTDGNGINVSVDQMSDGYRSILSMTFELIRQLVRVYGSKAVFRNIEEGEMYIDLPGVVCIDEIDAHLHPTWQTRIGQWFIKYFPNIQFIVTTHSPLVCRAAEKGSIWRLAAPGSDHTSGEITGLDKDRLIYGNVLDAYGTEAFGEGVSISQKADDMLNRLAELNVKSMIGEINDNEHVELQNLKAVLPTESKL